MLQVDSHFLQASPPFFNNLWGNFCSKGCWLTSRGTTRRGTSMISAFSSEKDPRRANSTKKAGHTESKATTRTRHIIHSNGTCSHEHNSKDVHNNGIPRPSFNDLTRPVVFFVLLRSSLFPTLCIMTHCMSHCTCSNVLFFFSKETKKNSPHRKSLPKNGCTVRSWCH